MELDLFPSISGPELARQMADRVPGLPGDTPADFWLGLLHPKLGPCHWPQTPLPAQQPPPAAPARHTRAPTTGGGLALAELEPESFAFRGCPGLYFVGETLDCAGTCGGFNLHGAFGSGLVAGRHAARGAARPTPRRKR